MKVRIGDVVESPIGRRDKRKGWRIRVCEIQSRIDRSADVSGVTRGGVVVRHVNENTLRPADPAAFHERPGRGNTNG